TGIGGVLGSPAYMSPEQAKGLVTVDHRTDIWSLGVVLYEAIAGRTPHVYDTVGQLILAICSEDAPSIQQFAPEVPNDVAELIHRAIQRDPDARFQSASEMLDAIEALVPEGCALTTRMITPDAPPSVRRPSMPAASRPHGSQREPKARDMR